MLLRYLPSALVASLIFWLSSHAIALPVSSFVSEVMSVVAHLVLYGALGAALAPAVGPQRRPMAILIAIVYGISDEVHQSQVPGRDAHVVDVIVDGIGAWIGVVLYGRAAEKVRARLAKREKTPPTAGPSR